MTPRALLGMIADHEPSMARVLLPNEEAALVERVRNGDTHAFQVLFHQYYAPLHAFVLGMVRDREVADECVQDVLHQVWMLGARWRIQSSVRTYLYTAARNHALNYLKHRRVVTRWAETAAVDLTISGMSQGTETTDAAARRHELAAAVRAAMARLPERRRAVLTLRIQHGLKNPEIAGVLGISIKNVERHLMLALRTLRQDLAAFF